MVEVALGPAYMDCITVGYGGLRQRDEKQPNGRKTEKKSEERGRETSAASFCIQ